MSVREAINNKKSIGVGIAILFLLISAGILAYTQLPQHHLKGDEAFYTVDDGQSWYVDSNYLTPPFDHNGKTAVEAVIYSYDHGNKTYCAYLTRYTSSAKKRLDDAIALAIKNDKPVRSVALFTDPGLTRTGVEVKLPGSGHSWVLRGTIEGSNTMNEGLSAHADDTSDVVVPE